MSIQQSAVQAKTEKPPEPGLPEPIDISLYDFARAFRFGDNPIFNFRVLSPKLQDSKHPEKKPPKPTKEELAQFSSAKVPYFAWLQSVLDPYGVKSKPFKEDVALGFLAPAKNSTIRKLSTTNGGPGARAVYFVVNQGGQEKKDIKQITAFFFEDDERSLEEQYARLMALPIPPDIIVKTKNSLHAYWLAVETTTIEQWEAVQRTSIVYANSDPTIKDLPRVMRAPGFDHTTFDFETGQVTRVPVTCLKFDVGERHTAEQMLAMLASLGQAEVSKAEFDTWLKARNGTNKQRVKVRQERERKPREPLYTDNPPKDLQERFNAICAKLSFVGPAGDSQRATCPSCEDASPSLIVGLTADKILMTCHAGCTFGEICEAIGVEQKHCFTRSRSRERQPPVNDSADLSPEALAAHADEIYSGGGDGRQAVTEMYAGSQDPAKLAATTWRLLDESEQERPTLFNFNDVLVRLSQSKKDPGVLCVQPLAAEMMRYRLNRLVKWWKKTQFGNEVDCPAPGFLVADMLASPLNETPVPVLNRIASEPIFNRNGRLVNTPGFHRDSGIYYTPRFESLPVPKKPTREEMISARDFLTDLISDFPFEADSSRDNAIAVGLVPFVREMIRGPVPLGFPTAAVPRTGKTKLLKILLGRGNYLMITYSAEEPEMRKKITTAIMSGFASVIIDNVNDTLDSAPLAAVLTGETWNDRLLCTNQSCNVAPTIQWTATANNPVTSREISGRSVVARLVAQTDRPEERDDFKIPDIEIYADKNRAQIVQAFLTMAAYWIAEGMPAPARVKFGGFEDYVRVVGGILQCCGLTLLKNYRETSDALDNERSAIATLCNAWWTAERAISADGVTTIPWKAGKIWDIAQDIDGLPAKVSDARQMGYYLKSLDDRRVEFTGPERDLADGEKIEAVPRITRRFIVRKCSHTVQRSNVYQLELVEESHVGLVGVVGVSQSLHQNTSDTDNLSPHTHNGNDPHARARADKSPTTPTTPTYTTNGNGNHQTETKDLGGGVDFYDGTRLRIPQEVPPEGEECPF